MMTPLQPGQTVQFLKRFKFAGGRFRRFRIHNRSREECSAQIGLAVVEVATGKRTLLNLELDGVEEYRFQRRPGPGLVRLKEVRLAVFNGLFYLNLDAFADDGPPAIHEFRASDAFVASRAFSFEAVAPPPAAAE